MQKKIYSALGTHPTRECIIFIISSLGGGGAEFIVSMLVNYYAEHQIRVLLITLDADTDHEAYTINPRVHRICIHNRFLTMPAIRIFGHLYRAFVLMRHIRKYKPLTVISFMTPTNLLAIGATCFTNIKCVISERTDPRFHTYGPFWSIARDLLYPLADTLIVQNSEIQRYFTSYLNMNIAVIPNFLPRKFSKEIKVDELHKNNVVLTLSRLSDEKSIDKLITAFSRVHQLYPDWKLIVAGTGVCKNALIQLSIDLNVSEDVIFAGFLKDPDVILKKASVYVQPSKYEGFPNALLRAMAWGIPVIATYNAGHMLLDDNINGLIVKNNDSDSLTEALIQLMSSDTLRTSLGSEAIRVRYRFSFDQIISLWNLELLGLLNLPS